MTIETDFNIEDTIFILASNQICERKIKIIHILIDKEKKIWTKYDVDDYHGNLRTKEELFKTKGELIESLLNK